MKSAVLAATAYHEAGHAVAAILRGIRFDYVTITAEEDAKGHIRYLRGARGLRQVHDRGVTAMAGEAAQRRFSSSSVRRYHGAGDREAVASYAFKHVGSAAAATALAHLWDVQARDLVEVQWPRIEQLATLLLDKRRLSEAECKAAMFQPVQTKERA